MHGKPLGSQAEGLANQSLSEGFQRCSTANSDGFCSRLVKLGVGDITITMVYGIYNYNLVGGDWNHGIVDDLMNNDVLIMVNHMVNHLVNYD